MEQNTKPKYPIYDKGQLRVSISQRNIKLGNIPQFNTLPGDEPLETPSGRPLTNIKGTCGKYCKECKSVCYAVRCARIHHNTVIPAWGANTVILRNDPEKVRREINEYCRKNIVKYFRFHTSGELESTEQLSLYCDICDDNPDVTFYIYTKRLDLIVEYFHSDHGQRDIPSNFVINVSEWRGSLDSYATGLDDGTEAFLKNLNLFAYDDGTEATEHVRDFVHCPAIDSTGHETGITCAQCRRCMRKGSVTAVYQH
jgi:hypothetical protein